MSEEYKPEIYHGDTITLVDGELKNTKDLRDETVSAEEEKEEAPKTPKKK